MSLVSRSAGMRRMPAESVSASSPRSCSTKCRDRLQGLLVSAS